jgi:hypothetical protein
MRAAIEGEASQRGVNLTSSYSPVAGSIEFSHHDSEGRLWTEAVISDDYEALCREVKKGASFDRESGLWVKRGSHVAFVAHRKAKAEALARLVEKNRKYAIEVLGGHPASDEKKG